MNYLFKIIIILIVFNGVLIAWRPFGKRRKYYGKNYIGQKKKIPYLPNVPPSARNHEMLCNRSKIEFTTYKDANCTKLLDFGA